ncbi:MAG: protease HtpX [Verrucomicrobia bacterium]|nr:protease HtpX [Verrucomicrobiota bacterium]
MNLWNVSKRVLLFVAVNLLVLVTISLVLTVLGVGRYLGGGGYGALMGFCLVWGMGGAFISLALSRLMAKWMMGVQVVDPDSADPQVQELVQTVRRLAQRAGLPAMPEVGIYDSPEINAFATGPSRSRALVAVSSGLLHALRSEEVEGVLGHELTHVANGDMVTMTLLQGIINAFVMFLARVLAFALSQAMRSRDDDNRGGGWFFQFVLIQVFQVVLSLFGMLVVNWFSRWREFRADAGGARLAGRERMIGALRALQRIHEPPSPELAGGPGPDAFRSLKIASPRGALWRWFADHPPLEERIARLEAGA